MQYIEDTEEELFDLSDLEKIISEEETLFVFK